MDLERTSMAFMGWASNLNLEDRPSSHLKSRNNKISPIGLSSLDENIIWEKLFRTNSSYPIHITIPNVSSLSDIITILVVDRLVDFDQLLLEKSDIYIPVWE